MRTMTNLEKFGLAAALIVACSFFYLKYMYDPQTKVLKTTLQKRNKIVADINQLNEIPPLFRLEKAIERDQERLAELKKENQSLSVKTGDPDEITQLLSRITELIEGSRLKISAIEPVESFMGPYFRWSPFQISMTGSFDRFMHFLYQLKALDDAVEVTRVKIEKSGETASPLQIRFLLKI
ncbi:MAG: type 4a pilus biogenesis protein PilO [Desulfobacterales bacterium]|nr:type 4a pilus biogenesis protein PilO [Desulfobacterales bacterium]